VKDYSTPIWSQVLELLGTALQFTNRFECKSRFTEFTFGCLPLVSLLPVAAVTCGPHHVAEALAD